MEGHEGLREHLADRLEGRGHLRELLADRLEGREDLRELLADRLREREDLRDLILDRLGRRALLRELLAEHVASEEGRTHSGASEHGSKERASDAGRISRDDLRELILNRIRDRGEAGELLDELRDRIGGEE